MATRMIRDVLPQWTLDAVIGHRNLTLVPLSGPDRQGRFLDYLLTPEAIEAGLLTVTEVDAAGSVPELLAANDADRPVLLIDGEELQGAKQNRILNTSVLLAARSRTRLPVSCVEQGRWNSLSTTFRSGHYAPSSLRRRKSRDVQHSLRTRGRPESDQGAVWDEVAEQIRSRGASSPTRAMSDAIISMREVLEQYQRALPYPAGACGVVAAVCGRFVALDAFDCPSAMQVMWDRLVASYAMDAQSEDELPSNVFSDKAAGEILAYVGEQQVDRFPAVGLGEELRFEAPAMLGQALCVEEHLLHLSAFPPADDLFGRRHSHRIMPPSRRRR